MTYTPDWLECDYTRQHLDHLSSHSHCSVCDMELIGEEKEEEMCSACIDEKDLEEETEPKGTLAQMDEAVNEINVLLAEIKEGMGL